MEFKQAEVDELLAKTGRRCCICKQLHQVQVHHIVPREKGGSNEIENAIPLCPTCHDAAHKLYAPGSVTRVYTPDELRIHRELTIEWVRSATFKWIGNEVLARYDEFPYDRVGEVLEFASHRLLVWHTWTEYFDLVLHSGLVRFLKRIWTASPAEAGMCRILLAHPQESFCARLRAKTLTNDDLEALISRTASDLQRAVENAVEELKLDIYGELINKVEVRLYKSVLTAPIYIVDRRAFVGWYPDGRKSHFAPYLEIDADRGNLIRKLELWFIKAWEEAEWVWDFDSGKPEPVKFLSDESRRMPGV